MTYVAKVRYGLMKFVKDFYSDLPGLRVGDKVVLDTDRGQEVGEIMTHPDEAHGCDCSSCPKLVRKFTGEDERKLEEIEEGRIPEEYRFCADKIHERNMPMKLTSVEHLYDAKKIIFYFVSKGRVDFRELVKDLARQYRSRIEMRQIGVRDEARLLASYQRCGRELCCRTWLKGLEPVTMKMAKSQKATLDPSKISGRCGRLMCCLRYENDVYEELKPSLPKKGSQVMTPHGKGKVIDHEILRQRVTIRTKDERLLSVEVKDITKSNEGDKQAVG
ncbi:MAG: stage 0 sporulation protein [Candidatus Brocadiales bacterium]|nr:stage 0 sporulation protein [Candidatus Bathyanammoxibius sp.]